MDINNVVEQIKADLNESDRELKQLNEQITKLKRAGYNVSAYETKLKQVQAKNNKLRAAL